MPRNERSEEGIIDAAVERDTRSFRVRVMRECQLPVSMLHRDSRLRVRQRHRQHAPTRDIRSCKELRDVGVGSNIPFLVFASYRDKVSRR